VYWHNFLFLYFIVKILYNRAKFRLQLVIQNILKNSENKVLLSRLRRRLNSNKAHAWTSYLHKSSKVYHQPQQRLETEVETRPTAMHSKKFILVTKELGLYTDDNQYNCDYGYIFDWREQKVYLAIPKDNGIYFEEVKDKAAEGVIRELIPKKDAMRAATWEEMDTIIESFTEKEYNFVSPMIPKFIDSQNQKIDYIYNYGQFKSAIHAPNAYALRRYILNSVIYELKNGQQYIQKSHNIPDIDPLAAENLLSESWFARPKANFSWHALIDGLLGNIPKAYSIKEANEKLILRNQMSQIAKFVDDKLSEANPNLNQIKGALEQLQCKLKTSVRDDIFIELFYALGGVIIAPFAFLVGIAWIIPALFLNLPYLGTKTFLLDAAVWFADSLLAVIRCVIFPIAMLHAYNTTGSSNILKGESTRIVEALLAKINDELNLETNSSNVLSNHQGQFS
jgi:hypothetical protein